jgi:hypothetical protein
MCSQCTKSNFGGVMHMASDLRFFFLRKINLILQLIWNRLGYLNELWYRQRKITLCRDSYYNAVPKFVTDWIRALRLIKIPWIFYATDLFKPRLKLSFVFQLRLVSIEEVSGVVLFQDPSDSTVAQEELYFTSYQLSK